jgi:hypothetical protein
MAEKMPECPRCTKPLAICICDRVEPVQTQLRVVMLQHPQEDDEILGTAKLVELTLLTRKRAADCRGVRWITRWAPRMPTRIAGPCWLPRSCRSKFRRKQRAGRCSSSIAKAGCGTCSGTASTASSCSTARGARRRRYGGAMPGCCDCHGSC